MQNEELHNFHSSPNMIRAISSMRNRLVVACTTHGTILQMKEQRQNGC